MFKTGREIIRASLHGGYYMFKTGREIIRASLHGGFNLGYPGQAHDGQLVLLRCVCVASSF